MHHSVFKLKFPDQVLYAEVVTISHNHPLHHTGSLMFYY